MNPIFFIIWFASFGILYVVYGYGFEEEAYKLTKYLIAFFSGMALAQVMA